MVVSGQKRAQAKPLKNAKTHVKRASTIVRDAGRTAAINRRRKLVQTQPVRTITQKPSTAKKPKKDVERRLLMHRNHAPKSFLEKLARAQTQRMIVLGRSRLGSGQQLREEIDIAGTTGNVYKVTIGRTTHCTCPDHSKGNECKHKVYVLHTVLKARYELQYQRAFLTTELEEIFANAPPIPTETSQSDNRDGKRRPVEGECPICYMEMDEKTSDIVWCKAACGNNMHKTCFDQWATSQRGKAVRCVYCRMEWQMDAGELKNVKIRGPVGPEGYINVAEQLGLSTVRDYSTYYQPWVRGRFAYG